MSYANKYSDAVKAISLNGGHFDSYEISDLEIVYNLMFHEMPHIVHYSYYDYDIDKAQEGLDKEIEAGHMINKGEEALVLIGEELIIMYEGNVYFVLSHNREVLKRIDTYFEKITRSGKKFMEYVTHGSSGFNTREFDVKEMDANIEMNYNDDLPHDKIMEIISSDESGIIILHGDPGCGKTSYLRHLIYNSDCDFCFLDSSTFHYITESSFIELLLRNKNKVFVLEDCEELLMDRAHSHNRGISALLNLSDGILGDALNLKFICTFNSNLDLIDKALLRKGRMKMKYEFKALTKDKANALAVKIDVPAPNKDTALCDIYNQGKNQVQEKTQHKIGFR